MIVWGYATLLLKKLRNTNAYLANYQMGIYLALAAAVEYPYLKN